MYCSIKTTTTTLAKGSAAAKVTASLRNSAVSFPEHLFYRGFTWRGYLNESGVLEVRVPQTTTDGLPPGTWNGTSATASECARPTSTKSVVTWSTADRPLAKLDCCNGLKAAPNGAVLRQN